MQAKVFSSTAQPNLPQIPVLMLTNRSIGEAGKPQQPPYWCYHLFPCQLAGELSLMLLTRACNRLTTLAASSYMRLLPAALHRCLPLPALWSAGPCLRQPQQALLTVPAARTAEQLPWGLES